VRMEHLSAHQALELLVSPGRERRLREERSAWHLALGPATPPAQGWPAFEEEEDDTRTCPGCGSELDVGGGCSCPLGPATLPQVPW